jgi:hypothetical protein
LAKLHEIQLAARLNHEGTKNTKAS